MNRVRFDFMPTLNFRATAVQTLIKLTYLYVSSISKDLGSVQGWI